MFYIFILSLLVLFSECCCHHLFWCQRDILWQPPLKACFRSALNNASSMSVKTVDIWWSYFNFVTKTGAFITFYITLYTLQYTYVNWCATTASVYSKSCLLFHRDSCQVVTKATVRDRRLERIENFDCAATTQSAIAVDYPACKLTKVPAGHCSVCTVQSSLNPRLYIGLQRLI